MSEQDALHGLNCPRCGGMVPIPEGQVVVHCPYCELRSLVRGERGLQRSQVPRQIDRQAAQDAMRRFLGAHRAIARDASRRATLEEGLLVYLPFWAVWGNVLAWVFGEEQVGSGDNKRYEPREVKIAEEMNWTGAACDVGEFGVERIPLTDQPLEPFDADLLHETSLVFEPVGSRSDAEQSAETDFQDRVRELAQLDRVAQVFMRTTRRLMGLVYYPLWVMRYLYRGRVFQVVVDGYSGKVLFGKAPGDTLYRAAMLVGGMALGAILMVDGSALILNIAFRSDDGGDALWLLLGSLTLGVLLMRAAYRRFRYGEQFEYRGPRGLRSRIRDRVGGVWRAREKRA